MQQIGPYTIRRELGRGAMGVVYEATEPTRNEPVAIKVLLDPTPDVRERFQREGQVLTFLGRHAHIVGFRDMGQVSGRPYLVMDYIAGQTLDAVLEARSLGRTRLLRLLVRVARALHFAHEAGVIHRDLKPQNIIVQEGTGLPFLTDFGIAKNVRDESLTKTGTLMGTLSYMAPEQVESSRRVDRRADVYALGAILYQGLTGKKPFHDGSEMSMMKKILTERPVSPRRFDTGIPQELERICLRALAKEADDRFPTAEAFARALENAIEERRRTPAGVGWPILGGMVAVLCLLAFFGGRMTAAEMPDRDGGTGVSETDESGTEPEAGDEEVDRLLTVLRRGETVDPDILSRVGESWGRWARAENARLAGNGEQVKEALPARSKRVDAALYQAEALWLLDVDGRPFFEVLDRLHDRLADEEEELAELPWRRPTRSDRWVWLADLEERAGRSERAAEALLSAVEDEPNEERALDHLDRACRLSILTVSEREGMGDRLHAAASEGLQEAVRSPGCGRIERARRRLTWARLLLPEKPMREDLKRLIRLGRHSDENVAFAARPWAREWVYHTPHSRVEILGEEVDPVLTRGNVQEWYRLLAVANSKRLHSLEGARHLALLEWVVARPDRQKVWEALGQTATQLGQPEVAYLVFRRALVLEEQEPDTLDGKERLRRADRHFDLAHACRRLGRLDQALEHGRRTQELINTGYRRHDFLLMAELYVHNRQPREALEKLEYLWHRRKKNGMAEKWHFWRVRAAAERLRENETRYRQYLQEARRLEGW